MKKEKTIAINLRKKGKSYNEIAKITGVSKSTLSGWFKACAWSEDVKKHLLQIAKEKAKKRMTAISHRKRKERIVLYRTKRDEAKILFEKFKKENLFIAGLMLYWGEGDSKLENGHIRLTNSDPLMIKLFYKFLKRYLSEIAIKTKIYLILYPDLNDDECKKMWSKKVGLPLNKFFKSSFIQGKCPTKRLNYGIGTICICNRAHKEIIITWINLIKKENIARA